jgi:FkbM family methyltransferase|tara:strand:- start:2913 stop:3542 length:630 start_codon:yes stop_codon:yes gene_type:complete
MQISKPKSEGWLGKYRAGTKNDNTFLGYQLEEYKKAMRKTVNRRTALDLGANLGVMSYRMVSDFEHVHAFEPLFYDHLKLNVSANNFTVHPFAVGDIEKSVTMRIGHHHCGGSNIIDDDYPDSIHYRNVKVITIDSYKFENVDFIKIDVEKYEFNVLMGASNTIKKNRPVMLVEVDPIHTIKVFDYFKKLNYIMQKVADKDYIFAPEEL